MSGTDASKRVETRSTGGEPFSNTCSKTIRAQLNRPPRSKRKATIRTQTEMCSTHCEEFHTLGVAMAIVFIPWLWIPEVRALSGGA